MLNLHTIKRARVCDRCNSDMYLDEKNIVETWKCPNCEATECPAFSKNHEQYIAIHS